METDKPPSNSTKEKYYIDSTYIHRPREGVEMRHPLKDGLGKIQGAACGVFIPVPMLVEDWDLYQRLLDHLFSRHIKSQPEEHPVLMSEMPVWVPV